MKTCPRCQRQDQQIKIGFTRAGSQRYKCKHCGKKYTPEAKQAGYPQALRQQAIGMYVDGINFRRIARHLGVHHQTVINWVNAHVESLPPWNGLPCNGAYPLMYAATMVLICRQGCHSLDRTTSLQHHLHHAR